jgi:hypothetical protein
MHGSPIVHLVLLIFAPSVVVLAILMPIFVLRIINEVISKNKSYMGWQTWPAQEGMPQYCIAGAFNDYKQVRNKNIYLIFT